MGDPRTSQTWILSIYGWAGVNLRAPRRATFSRSQAQQPWRQGFKDLKTTHRPWRTCFCVSCVFTAEKGLARSEPRLTSSSWPPLRSRSTFQASCLYRLPLEALYSKVRALAQQHLTKALVVIVYADPSVGASFRHRTPTLLVTDDLDLLEATHRFIHDHSHGQGIM